MTLVRKIMSLSLRIKFVVPVTALLITCMLVVSGYLIERQSEIYFSVIEMSGETMLRMTANNAESAVLFGAQYEMDELLNMLMAFQSVSHAAIKNADGAILASANYNSEDEMTFVRNAAHKHAIAIDQNDKWHQEFKSKYCKDINGRQLLVLTAPILTLRTVLNRESLGITAGPNSQTGSAYESEIIGSIEIGLSLEEVNKSIAESKAAAVFLTALIVLVTIVVLAFIITAITRPVSELVKITDQVSRGDLSQKVELDRNDEIGQLAATFNKMIESLKQSRDEIEVYNRNLEEKIIERTQQLEDSQTQLIQSEKMSAIGQLAAGVAHELNNPLGGILGYAQFTLEKLLKMDAESITDKDVQSYRRYLSDIETQARRCKVIVQNLLRFSRSSRSMDFTEIDVNQLIEETIEFVSHQLHLSQIKLETSLCEDLPLFSGNGGQLQQVFTNLIINSMHASEPGSVIRIESRCSPSLGEFGGAIELLFIDGGCGIEEEHLNKIFEPFYTTKDIGKGTGLGLSVSYGIIREHGGEITVASTLGKGTTFVITLPVMKPARESDNIREIK